MESSSARHRRTFVGPRLPSREHSSTPSANVPTFPRDSWTPPLYCHAITMSFEGSLTRQWQRRWNVLWSILYSTSDDSADEVCENMPQIFGTSETHFCFWNTRKIDFAFLCNQIYKVLGFPLHRSLNFLFSDYIAFRNHEVSSTFFADLSLVSA